MKKYKIENCFYTGGYLITKLNSKSKYEPCFSVSTLSEARWYLKNPESIELKIIHNRNITYSVLAVVSFFIFCIILTLK